MKEEDFKIIAELIHRAIQLGLRLQREAGSLLLKDFERVALTGTGETAKAVKELYKDVRALAMRFPLPGVDVRTLTKPEGIESDD